MRSKIIILCFILTVLSCIQDKDKPNKDGVQNIVKSELQSILDTNNVNGVILIFDFEQNKFYSNNFEEAKKGFIPASTFKISNSIIGLETSILKDEHTIFKWDGNDRAFSSWEQDLTLKEAFQRSCVPCYQELARKIGVKRMNENLDKLGFGNMDVNKQNIDTFWLLGKSQISPFNQIEFLNRLYNNKLPISIQTSKTVRNILKIEQNENYIINGKTGLAIANKKPIGWFVGYIEKGKKLVYFATKISPNKNEMPRIEFTPIRKKVSISALKTLKIIE